ncbi:uncharacterized protein LOC125484819 isoform X1 [Rhincodon typus]|uniref:uncharacterized protein LOC125484819 isoform X1 n=1 Tax=Rhincodon typus TaxID=259920 RepID=UPI0020305F3E|nr:uncharacterized protein LOC125484819 isoform X1 [Rhincodon typus]
MWLHPLAQNHLQMMITFNIGHLALLWVSAFGLSSVSIVETYCLKCEKKIQPTLKLIDYQIQLYPSGSNYVRQLTFINAFLQGKKLPTGSQNLPLTENIHKELANPTELSANVLTSIRNEIHNFLKNNFENKKMTTITAVVRQYAQLIQAPVLPDQRCNYSNYIRLVHCGTCKTRNVACLSGKYRRTKRGIRFKVGKIKLDMLSQSSKIPMPRSVLYSIPVAVAIVGFLCFITFYCDVPHR